MSSVPMEAYAAALAGLPGLGPARLTSILSRYEPEAALAALARGSVGSELLAPASGETDLADRLRKAAREVSVEALWQRYVDAGVTVTVHSHPGYPESLADDCEAPAVLFSIGDQTVLDAPRVAIIGTRKCSRYGLDLAHEFATDLTRHGVCVVSGLALGIDGAAHRGALGVAGGRPVGVVGSGLDKVYPRAHRELWAEVAEAGWLCSETALGVPPAPWRFPARNRIIAALCDVLVVVESGVRGGSLLTVREAYDRNRTVMAVPGAVRSPTSVGTNRLLADGVQPALDPTDVLVALGFTEGARRGVRAQPARIAVLPAGRVGTGSGGVEVKAVGGSELRVSARGRRVLDELGWEPATLDMLMGRVQLSIQELSAEIEGLVQSGLVARRGGWFEQISRR